MSRLTDLESRLAFAFDTLVKIIGGEMCRSSLFLGGTIQAMDLSNIQNYPT
jgi:hypothetical protein